MTIVKFRLALGVEVPQSPPVDAKEIRDRCERVAHFFDLLSKDDVVLDLFDFRDLLTHLESIEQTVRRARASHRGKDEA